MFDQPVKLNFRNRTKYSSGVTQVLSLVLLITLFGMFNFYLREYLTNGNTSIQKSVTPANSFIIDRYYTEKFQLKIGLRNNRNQEVDPNLLRELLEVADLTLFISDQPTAYNLSV